jgi:hypothetical protein
MDKVNKAINAYTIAIQLDSSNETYACALRELEYEKSRRGKQNNKINKINNKILINFQSFSTRTRSYFHVTTAIFLKKTRNFLFALNATAAVTVPKNAKLKTGRRGINNIAEK